MHAAQVAQIMLDSGNDKLNEAMKQLVNGYYQSIEREATSKLMKAQGTFREMTMKRKNTDEEPAGPSTKKRKHK